MGRKIDDRLADKRTREFEYPRYEEYKIYDNDEYQSEPGCAIMWFIAIVGILMIAIIGFALFLLIKTIFF